MLKSDTDIEDPGAASGLPILMVRAGHAAMRAVDAELAPFGISLIQYVMLSRLAELAEPGGTGTGTGTGSGTPTPGMLARACGMDSGAMTRLLDRMESKRMLERSHEAKDRRTISLRLTEHGRSLLPALGAAVARAHTAMFCKVPAHELALFRACLDSIVGLPTPPQEAL